MSSPDNRSDNSEPCDVGWCVLPQGHWQKHRPLWAVEPVDNKPRE